jgi:hypothetical protein
LIRHHPRLNLTRRDPAENYCENFRGFRFILRSVSGVFPKESPDSGKILCVLPTHKSLDIVPHANGGPLIMAITLRLIRVMYAVHAIYKHRINHASQQNMIEPSYDRSGKRLCSAKLNNRLISHKPRSSFWTKSNKTGPYFRYIFFVSVFISFDSSGITHYASPFTRLHHTHSPFDPQK